MPGVMAGQQSYIVYKDLSKKHQKKFDKAERLATTQDYPGAHQILDQLKAQEPDFVDAYLKKAAIYLEESDTLKAISELEQALNMAPSYRINTHRFLASLYYRKSNFEKAIIRQTAYIDALKQKNKNIDEAVFKLACYSFAAKAVKNPVPFQPIALSESINTDTCSEYLPSFTADERNMIFTRRNENLENLYTSSRLSEHDDWSPAVLFHSFNTAENEGAFNMSADGKTIIFTRCGINPELENYSSCDLYESNWINGRWSQPVSLTNINTYAWESQPCISENGQTLAFSSNRIGGYGKTDIYFSYKDKKGIWSAPVNGGPIVNTNGNEAAPFYHADGTSLYFMSDGHVGMGDYDLFLCKLEKGKWLSPINLGYPINTREQEGAFVVSLDGQTAYFARADKQADIIRFELYAAVRPNPVTYVKGIVKDKKTGKPIESRLDIERTDGNQAFTIHTDRSGEFLITLPLEFSYSFNVAKEHYLFYSERFEFSEESKIYEPIYLEIQLDSIDQNIVEKNPQEIILKNVLFKIDSAELLESSYTELTKLEQLLKENPGLKIEIQGHTDNVGTEDYNLLLSEARAKVVYEYLLSEGIHAEQIRYSGYGEQKPIDTNITEKGRANNRRTSFIVVEND